MNNMLDSGFIGQVTKVSWNSPVISYFIDGVDDEQYAMESDTIFVLRNGVMERIFAIDLIHYDKIISITPKELIEDNVRLF